MKVISASRRVDMVAGYPELLVDILNTKCPPADVHTIVVWTKNASNLLHHQQLRATLVRYDQLYLHYSITGIGGTVLEPNIPATKEALAMLPGLIELVNGPDRVRVRFDPIVHLRLPSGEEYTNLPEFEPIAEAISSLAIRDVSTSWMQLYSKVDRRLRDAGIEPLEVSDAQWKEEANQMRTIASRYGLVLHGCCVVGWPRSRCIDGELLNRLHPKGHTCSTRRARGQRALCGCTESWDIGWYKKCVGGCVYCYANPATDH